MLRDRQYCSSTPAVSAALVERIGTREDAPYYIMDLEKGMAETVAPMMPSAAQAQNNASTIMIRRIRPNPPLG